MAYRLVTCPESAHLELIEYEESPCGMLIVGCSVFRPPCAVDCARICAGRLDQRNRGAEKLDTNEPLLSTDDPTSVDARRHIK